MKYDVIILAGGLGTRLRSVVADLPKPMAPVNGRPFLHYILESLDIDMVNSIILSVGYKHEVIKEEFGESYKEIPVQYAVENEPLGTGGGIKLALSLSATQHVLILNGDTFFKVDIKGMFEQHSQHNALLTVALKDMKDPYRYGAVETEGFKVTAFKEKDESLQRANINGGVYFVNRSILELFPAQAKSSFESDILEKYVNKAQFEAYISDATFIDIGVPEDFAKAQWLFKSRNEWAEYTLFLDRDGVINTPKPDDYVKDPSEFIFTVGAIDALKVFRSVFKYIFVVTNQQGIHREIMSDIDLEDVHLKMHKELINNDIQYFDGVFYAPYLRSAEHHWRKPARGMIEQALRYKADIDTNKLIMVGDSPGDMALGESVDALKVRVMNPQFEFDHQDLKFDSLAQFAQFITQN